MARVSLQRCQEPGPPRPEQPLKLGTGGSHQAPGEDTGSVAPTAACSHSAAAAPGFLEGPGLRLCLPRDLLSRHQPGPVPLTSPTHWHLLAGPPGWHPSGWDPSILLFVSSSSYCHPTKPPGSCSQAPKYCAPTPSTLNPSQGASEAPVKRQSVPLPLEPRCSAAAERTGQQLCPGLRGAAHVHSPSGPRDRSEDKPGLVEVGDGRPHGTG